MKLNLAVCKDNYGCYSGQCNLTETEYSIYSSVLGKVLTEVTATGTKRKTNVYGTGGIVATQNIEASTVEVVRFEHLDPHNQSYVETAGNGQMYYLESPAELDPLGSNVGLGNPNQQLQNASPNTRWGDPFGGYSCRMDGFEVPCSQAMYAMSIGLAFQSPDLPSSVAFGRYFVNTITEEEWFEPFFNIYGNFNNPPAITQAITDATNLVNNVSSCKSKIDELLRKSAEAMGLYEGLSEEEKAAFDKGLTAENLLKAVTEAENVEHADDPRVVNETADGYQNEDATTSFPNGTPRIDYYGGFYGTVTKGKKLPIPKNGLNYEYSIVGKTSWEERARTIIHEGFHAFYPGFSDSLVGTAAAKIMDPKFKGTLNKTEGSLKITEFIKKYCNKK